MINKENNTNGIETLFKEALSGHSIPFDKTAWATIQSKMNARSIPKKWFQTKLFYTGIISTLVGSGAILYFASTLRENKKIAVSHENAQQSQSAKNGSIDPVNFKVAIEKNNQQNTNNQANCDRLNLNPKNLPSTDLKDRFYGLPSFIVSEIDEEIENSPEQNTKAAAKNYKKITLPSSICIGESVTIVNTNDAENILVILQNGSGETIKAGDSQTILADIEGTITVHSGEFTSEIDVKASRNRLDVISLSNEIEYENGLPTYKVEIRGNDNAVSWKNIPRGSEISPNGQLATFYPYKSKDILVEVESTDLNGCSISKSETINLSGENYNLLAVTGFSPLSGIEANKSFMPFALTQRDTPFTLMIIDPSNGAVIYKTNDSTRPWDGIDSRNGNLVTESSVWIWKVFLSKANLGENNEYKGTITRM